MSPPFEGVASERVPGTTSDQFTGSPAEVFNNLLDAMVAQLAPENAGSLDVPSDELHQEILLPLLPAMLADKAIRNHWREQKSSGFFARLQSHLRGEAPRPDWSPGDFEIHVTASYSAEPDARALADTLLSEESLRDLTAALVNQLLEPVWAQLPAAPEAPAEVLPEPQLVSPAAREPLAAPVEVPSPAEREAPAAPLPEVATTSAAPAWRFGTIARYRPFRPQPWQTRHNPLAGTHGPPGFADPLARNPLEQRSEPRLASRAAA
jgi:hypothetical protein